MFKQNHDVDFIKPWHEHLKAIRQGIQNGTIKSKTQLSDFDIATSFVIGIAYQAGYEKITTEMIYYLLKALTDVDVDQIKEDT